MRIMLFPKYIKNEELKPHILTNCRLVIDGQNFFYSCYQDSKLPHVFGAEANEYARYLRKLTSMFKNSNVECYFVFKGGSTDIDKKIQRFNAKYENQANQEGALPVFAKEVCKQVLAEIGVKYATCIYETKEDCVALAQALNCSVLSNDIEFCFKGAPYIPSTTLKYKARANRITCKQYTIKDFLQKHSLTKKKLAIFAALLDTNVFEQNHFNNLLQKWNVLDHNLYVQIKKLLKWLSEHSEQEALNSILEFLSVDSAKQKFLNQMTNVLKTMHYDDCDDVRCTMTSVVAPYLMNIGRNGNIRIYLSDPKWFEKGVASQNIAVPYINLYIHKCLIGSKTSPRNTNDCLLFSIDIIKYAYNLLTNFKSTEITLYLKSDGLVKITTKYNRIKPTRHLCRESVFENGWTWIKHFKLFEYFLVTNNIKTDFIYELPVEARMLFITLVYFARKKTSMNIIVTKEVYCFIMSYVLLHIVFEKKDSFRKKISEISEDDCDTVKHVTKKYFTCGTADVIDNNALNTLYELQYCLLHMNYLNTLCGSPFMNTKYHRTFNGTFIYKLLKDMEGSDAKEYIAKLLKPAQSVLKFVNKLISTYEKL